MKRINFKDPDPTKSSGSDRIRIHNANLRLNFKEMYAACMKEKLKIIIKNLRVWHYGPGISEALMDVLLFYEQLQATAGEATLCSRIGEHFTSKIHFQWKPIAY